jgi:alpha-galactosidase
MDRLLELSGMLNRVFPLMVLSVAIAVPAWPCSVIGPLPSAEDLVRRAEVIVRARVDGLAEPGPPKVFGGDGRGVQFQILETLKGDVPVGPLRVEGMLEERDDPNDRSVPYDFVRPGGRSGNCFALGYRSGAEYLLMLIRSNGAHSHGKLGELTPYWAPLGPANEQLVDGPNDAWLAWVRRNVPRQNTPPRSTPAAAATLTLDRVKASPSRIVVANGENAAASERVEVTRTWNGELCATTIVNRGSQAVRIKEVVLFSISHELPPETALYGESLQMLSQTGGTLGQPIDYGYSELKHYKVPQPADARVVSGLVTLTPPNAHPILLAFTSSRRFVGRFYLRPTSIDVVTDTEGLELAPGARWTLEELMVASGSSRTPLFDRLAARIVKNHPPLKTPMAPTGWCSWYCFGPKVTAAQVLENLDVIAKTIPRLTYVQIDDGYQPAMGDWLETGAAFGGDVLGVLKQIRERGFQPAIWVAPFIAEKGSTLFKQHPDWFIKGADGLPLPSNEVTFGGWRRGPWYALDGTHPAVQQHLEALFRTMRRDWGVTYFKLDANFWGMLHGGRFHDPKATRVEAYRRGMEAIRRGAGDGFILGCNHPIWASFGLIHGSRSSNDIKRSWDRVASIARQNLSRNWQNGRLWWNDPDAVVLTGGDLTLDEFLFHATSIYASGGMILSGDDLSKLPTDRMALLEKLLPPTGVAAEFDDAALTVGVMRGVPRASRTYAVFNWEDAPAAMTVKLGGACALTDFWTGADLGRHRDVYTIDRMPPHSARLLICRPVN